MKAKDILSDKMPTVSPDTPVDSCLAMMANYNINALPVTLDSIYKGMVVEKDLRDAEKKCSVAQLLIQDFPCILSEAHILEAVEMLAQNPERLLPVVSPDNHYLGTVTAQTALSGMAILCNTAHPGTIIETEMFPKDYTVTELSRLVEDNRCKIISLFSFPDNATGLLKVQIRINCEDASAVLQSLERFNYRITAIYRPEGRIDARTEQRLHELMYYLEM